MPPERTDPGGVAAWPTLEMRWFYLGPIPEGVMHWFPHATYPPGAPERRVDHYLQLDAADNLSVKLRAGRIEVKRRFRDYGRVAVSAMASGLMEYWHKWSFPLAEPGRYAATEPVPAALWMAVHKVRWQRTYQVTAQDRVVPVGDTPAGAGCNLELALVRARGTQVWSLALEAFGPESDLRESLLRVAHHALQTPFPLPLETSHSYGYARWLASLDMPSS
jgi:hypothetical protein